MCGRYSITTPVEGMQRAFGFPERPNLRPRYNLAPTQSAPVVRLGEDGRRHLASLRWGLIPSWAKEASIGNKLINARAETLAEKPSFRGPLKSRRCLVLADGFYEWREADGAKQPYRIALDDGGPFAFAGLWDRWVRPGDEALETFTIITTAANDLLRPIHDRMPVMLDPAAYDLWLTAPPREALAALDARIRPHRMTAYRVGTRVNSPKNDDPACIEPMAAAR
jgi:putative SOS response-associated peptidase YedK